MRPWAEISADFEGVSAPGSPRPVRRQSGRRLRSPRWKTGDPWWAVRPREITIDGRRTVVPGLRNGRCYGSDVGDDPPLGNGRDFAASTYRRAGRELAGRSAAISACAYRGGRAYRPGGADCQRESGGFPQEPVSCPDAGCLRGDRTAATRALTPGGPHPDPPVAWHIRARTVG